MLILSGLDVFHPDPSRPLILGIGNFDGLHLGHQALIQYVLEKTRRLQGVSGILTFREHPQQILHPESKPPLLMTSDYKLFLMKEFGIDYCFWIPFTETLSQMEPEVFVAKVLAEQLRVKEVCLGYNAHFGHRRKGDAAMMKMLAPRFGFAFEEIAPVKAAGDFVSSSRIRGLVRDGKLEEVFLCLGRPFSLMAKVVPGAGRGKGLGFPTANLEIRTETLPPLGVYPVELRILDLERIPFKEEHTEELIVRKKSPLIRGILNYGCRPTFETGGEGTAPVAEIHLFDFDANLYGKTLEVFFHPRLRVETAFPDVAALQIQVQQDIIEAKKYFKAVSKKVFTKIVD
ncbi:MAG TPA: riboflavin biosynthesis protein RibF [bacterium]|nr:riboflavin biosynthesis protein RibF [bacterium]